MTMLFPLLHLGFEQVRSYGTEAFTRSMFDIAKHLPVLLIVAFDKFEGPSVIDDITADQALLDLGCEF